MSRAQLLDRARRLALRMSWRARPEAGAGGLQLYSLVLVAEGVRAELVAHVRRLARRRCSSAAQNFRRLPWPTPSAPQDERLEEKSLLSLIP